MSQREYLIEDIETWWTMAKRASSRFYASLWIEKLLFLAMYLWEYWELTAIMVGLLVWHTVESRTVTNEPKSILSHRCLHRRVVYNALGHVVLAMMMSSCACMAAYVYPVLVGALYGILNNLFTVNDCLEYYTLGHIYCDNSEDKFESHAVKTHNPLIQALVTGCYGSVALSKYTGLAAWVFFRVERLPPLSVTLLCVLCALNVSHCVAVITKWHIQTLFDAYARISECQLSNDNLLSDSPLSIVHPKGCNPELDKVAVRIDAYIYHDAIPLRLVKGWAANAMRNRFGYCSGALGFVMFLYLQ